MRRPHLIRETMAINARARALAPVPRRAWKPVGLVWLKRARSSPLRIARPGTSLTSISRSTRFDLHFSFPLFMSSRASVVGLVVRTANLVRRQARGDRPSLLTLIHAHSAMERSSTNESRTRELLTATRSVSETISNEIHRPFRANTMRTGSTRRTRTPRQLPMLATREHLVEHLTRLTSVPRPGRDRIRHHLDRIQLPYRRPIAPVVSASPATGTITRRHAPPELVWASASHAETVEQVQPYASAAAPTLFPSASPTSLDQVLDTAAVVRTQMLDLALIDRVAEDVMGRMERRMRIERERRGI